MSEQQLREALVRWWCGWTHGGGKIERDALDRINWRCCKCGRWSDPVPAAPTAQPPQEAEHG